MKPKSERIFFEAAYDGVANLMEGMEKAKKLLYSLSAYFGSESNVHKERFFLHKHSIGLDTVLVHMDYQPNSPATYWYRKRNEV